MTTTWSNQKLKAIELLAAGGMTINEIQKATPVSKDTFWKWRKDPLFMEAVLKRSREILRDNLPSIYRTLAEKATDGDPRHISILLDHLEKLDKSADQYKGGSITVQWKGTWDEDESINPTIES
jgi:hypothetical protein